MTTQTFFLQDIFRQPSELQHTLDHLTGRGLDALQKASTVINSARNLFLTGIGASWHAAMSAASLFHLNGRPVYMQEAAELVHFTVIPRDAVIVVISRSGQSFEILQVLERARESRATVVGITNNADSRLAREAVIPIVIPARLDHAISVNTYSTLSIAAGALATASATSFKSVASSLACSLAELNPILRLWQEQLAQSQWLAENATYYFLARGCCLGSSHQARLLWEEAAKTPATAMSTSGFRHGPQEIVKKGTRFCMWLDSLRMRDQDLAISNDLRELGASVMLIGESAPQDAGDVVLQLPKSPPNWQFVTGIIPVQLAAERLAGLSGVNCDSFRLCSYIVQDGYGLLGKKCSVTERP